MNRVLAKAAIAAVTDNQYEKEPGFCQRFVRQVLARVYGNQYAGFMSSSAIQTAEAFHSAGLAVSPETLENYPIPGDILYKTTTSGKHGHVGIFVGDDKVAENSSTSLGRVSGAKGYRTVAQFGKVDWVVRLPEPEPEPEPVPGWTILAPDGKQIVTGIPTGERGTGLVRLLMETIGGRVMVDAERKTITVYPSAK